MSTKTKVFIVALVAVWVTAMLVVTAPRQHAHYVCWEEDANAEVLCGTPAQAKVSSNGHTFSVKDAPKVQAAVDGRHVVSVGGDIYHGPDVRCTAAGICQGQDVTLPDHDGPVNASYECTPRKPAFHQCRWLGFYERQPGL